MLELKRISSLQDIAGSQAIIYGSCAADIVKDEDTEQGLWNVQAERTFTGIPLELSKWSRNASTAQGATHLSLIRRLMSQDSTTELTTWEMNEDQVVTLISKVKITRSIPDREAIARRLFELVQDVKEEEPENGISLSSLRSFYSFLQINTHLRKPSIALTPSNDIYVSWKRDAHCVFSINFLASGLARFVIITTGVRSDQVVRLAGIANIESLIEKVKPWGVLKWIGREH